MRRASAVLALSIVCGETALDVSKRLMPLLFDTRVARWRTPKRPSTT
jgi:hypothetical protein